VFKPDNVLVLHLLTQVPYFLGHEPVLTKPVLLLCYLALQRTWVSRLHLATLLRPDSNEQVARHYLRLLLNRAKALPWADGLEIETQRLRFLVPTDVLAFQNSLGRTDWAAALALYQAPLLQNAAMDSVLFDEWLVLERSRLEGAWREAMLAQSQVLLAFQPSQAVVLLWRLWQHDEFDEIVFQMYLQAAYVAGERELPLVAYKKFVVLLEQEFGQVPSQQTQVLYQKFLTTGLAQIKVNPPFVPSLVLRPPQLVARVAEVEQIQHSQAKMLVVIGEPGAGKTRLVLEVLPKAQVLRGIEGLQGLSYAPLIAWADKQFTPEKAVLLGVYAEDIGRVVPAFSSTTRPSDAQNGKMRLFEAFARLLEFNQEPVVFDDLQWADLATLEFITFYLTRPQTRMVATLRQDEISGLLEQYLVAWQTERLILRPFAVTDVNVLLSSLIGSDVSHPVFSEFLFGRTGGNPFFMLEIIKDLFLRGALRVFENNWKSALDDLTLDYHEFIVPPRVEELILSRVARLSENGKRVLGAASVLTRADSADLMVLTNLGHADLLDALEELELAAMTRGNRFIHDLLRQSVYQSLSSVRRNDWHERAAQLPNLPLMARAEHYLQAGQNAKAVPLMLEESTLLQHLGLPLEALNVLNRILSLEPNLLEAVAKSALCQLQLHQYETALVLSEQLRLGSVQNRAIAWRVQAEWYYAKGDLQNAAKFIELALGLLEQFEYTESHFEEIAFDIFEAQQRYPEAIIMLEKAQLRLSQQGQSGDLAIILSSLAAIYDDTKRYKEALELHFQALNMARRTCSRYAQVNVSIQMMWALSHANRAEEAVQIAEEALSYGQFSNTQYLRNGYAAALIHLERFEEAVEQYQNNALNGDITTRTLAWGRLSELYFRLGDHQKIEKAVQQSLVSALQTQVPFAQIRAAIAILKYGTQAQLEQLLPHLKPTKSPDPISQAEYEAAVLIARERGLSI
jgi:DNA-binding SARP family transcriptional activator/predicted ATPase